MSHTYIDVAEGDPVPVITCTCIGYPEPVYRWSFDNVTSSNRSDLTIIDPANQDQSGIYVCTASNKHGMVKAETIITVLRKFTRHEIIFLHVYCSWS